MNVSAHLVPGNFARYPSRSWSHSCPEAGHLVKDKNGYLSILIRIRRALNSETDTGVLPLDKTDNKLPSQLAPGPFKLAGEFVNAVRRRNVQKQYDEAVARLYRSSEMIVRTVLILETGEFSSGFPVRKIYPLT